MVQVSEKLLQAMNAAIEVGKKSVSEKDRCQPKVGAAILITDKLTTAYRGELGEGDHAEFTLFEKKLKGEDISDAVLFTTLEPCTSRKTKRSCTQWILDKGIKRVYVGMLDPNPGIYARGVTILREHGVIVEFFPPELSKQIQADNAAFFAQFSVNPKLSGTVDCNYSHNNGRYTIGYGEKQFEIVWSKASDLSIHLCKDGRGMKSVRHAIGARSFQQLQNGHVYDASSRCITLAELDFAILENCKEHLAYVQVIDVKDRTRPPDVVDSVRFEYQIP